MLSARPTLSNVTAMSTGYFFTNDTSTNEPRGKIIATDTMAASA